MHAQVAGHITDAHARMLVMASFTQTLFLQRVGAADEGMRGQQLLCRVVAQREHCQRRSRHQLFIR